MIEVPDIDYAAISPLLVIAAAGVLGVVIEAFCPRGPRFVVQSWFAVLATLGALGASIWVLVDLDEIDGPVEALGSTTGDGALSIDGPGVVTWIVLSVFALMSMGLFAERRLEAGKVSAFTSRAADAPGSPGEAEATRLRLEHTEVFPLAMFALLGMMIFATSNDLLTMFVGLEVLSLPLYLLCGLSRRRRLVSQEAALKYFLLGAFSSVIFLYGVALAYGYAGTFALGGIAEAVTADAGSEEMLLAAMALIAVGLLFKIGAVPFHAWTPDVYQGAPTPVTAFMAAGTKVAAFIALLRVFFVAFGGASWDWRPMIWVIAAVTMLFGSLVAIAQSDVKRMLAYSSVAHAGFILVGVSGAYVAVDDRLDSISAVLFYLVVYGLASIGAFGMLSLVRDSGGEISQLSRWAGLGRTSPLLAGCMTVFLLSFAGIPLTGGFIGKWAVFSAAWSGDYWPLVVIGVLVSGVAAYFYVSVIRIMFFAVPDGEGPSVARPDTVTTVVVVLSAVGTLVLGIWPGPMLDLVQYAGAFVH